MSVISITLTESSFQIVAGIPSSIELSTNIPATIFYTIDGTEPTTSSSVYIEAINLPTNENAVTLKVFATDGTNTSDVITNEYKTSYSTARRPHASVSGLDQISNQAFYPYGTQDPGGPAKYGNVAGRTMDSPSVVGVTGGYDADGNPTLETDLPYNLENYDIIFTETNSIGERGRGIGTLPAEAILVVPPSQEPPQASSNTASPFFDAKALVIFQNDQDEPYDPEVSKVMRPYFDLTDPEKSRSGAHFYTSAFEGNLPGSSLLRQQFNPKDNTITYYYRDRETNRWIISKTKFVPQRPDLFNYSTIVTSSRQQGAGIVFQWLPFRYRTLF